MADTDFQFILHYNPDDLQVMHFDTNASMEKDASNKYATRTGYTFAILTDAELQTQLLQMGRECKVVLTDGVITDFIAAVNPIQPKAVAKSSLEQTVDDLKARIEVLEG